jgi:UDP-2,3-diacylglucosamine hydrolase
MTASLDTPSTSALPVIDGRGWSCIDFISDLHLFEQQPATFDAWSRYLQTTPAQALFILGDLFEVWVGDDVLDAPTSAFERACVACLHAASRRMQVHFMCGNRDFLAGPELMRRAGMQSLQDPTVLITANQRVLMSHGDAWCIDDHDYLSFRTEVRSPLWQQQFLQRPLAERQALARAMRGASETHKREHTTYADVDTGEALRWLEAAEAQVLVHGHTHRPATHALPDARERWVLSDWDLQAPAPRAQVLRWQGQWCRLDL